MNKDDHIAAEEVEAAEMVPLEETTDRALAKRSPTIPATLDEIAALTEEGQAIIEARAQVLRILRTESIRITSPQDWLLFRAEEPGYPPRITAYLQDSGCKRLAPLWGIDIIPEGDPVKVEADGEFAYLFRGNGLCKFTRAEVHDIEGLRYSTDDFLRGLTPVMREMRVRQAARANLDGNIIRQLAGMKVVPIEEIEAAWKGSGKTIDLCPRGRGFGSRAEREGQTVSRPSQPTDIPAPTCEHPSCSKQLVYRAAGTTREGKSYPAYWRCPLYEKGNGHSVVNDDEWRKIQPQPRDPGRG